MAGVDNPGQGSLIWFLKTTALFNDQSDSILSWADDRSRERAYARGDVISLLGDSRPGIYVVRDGQVKLRTCSVGGKEKILDIVGPGDTFGALEEVVAAGPQVAASRDMLATEAVALGPTVVVAFRFEEFQALVARRPTVVMNVSRVLGLKQRRLEIRLSRLLYRSSLGKVAGVLADLAERFGTRATDGSVLLDFKLTHQEIASLVGVKRETVSDCLGILELRELVQSKRSRIRVLRPEVLDDIV
ncbi:MAG: Crp/Fnr family transcriptional regulator [Candidatus Sumerlaeia bacterium]|nr:Crp/Fnr family transcriptional regulator [Candidatus Sumerlaeia bacterium]